MRIHNRIRFGLCTMGVGAALFLLGCPNPLLTQIEKTVEEVVTPPGITAIYPTNDSEDIPINLQVITVTLSKPVLASSVTSGTFKVTGSGGTLVTGTFEISNDTITFKPNGVLSHDTEYTITITGGVKDTDGNGLPAEYSWTFRTGLAPDTEPPDNIIVTINNDDEWTTSPNVMLAIVAEDNRGVAQMNISNSNSFSDSGWVTFTSPFAWTLGSGEGPKTVYVKVRDGAGNTSTTAEYDSINLDTIVPEIEAFRINYGNPATNSTLVLLTVDGNDGGSGPYQFRYRHSGADWEPWVNLTDDGRGEVADVALSVAEFGTEVFEAEMSDIAGNVSEIASASITYEKQPPSVDATFPEGGSANYPSNAGIVYITFSEPMNPNTITVDNFYVTQGSNQIQGSAVLFFVTDENGIYPDNTAVLTNLELNQNEGYTAVLLGTATDIAGNVIEADYSWFFRTSDALDTDPPVGNIVLDVDQPAHFTATVTSDPVLHLAIAATDTYNVVYGMKIWGDNDGSLPLFEDDAAWEPYATTKPWTVSAGDGYKYIFYKFMDASSNQTPTPYRLKIALDATDPVVTGVAIDGGAEYTNNPQGVVSVSIDADDTQGGTIQGSGLMEVMLGNDEVFTGGIWESWSPLITNWVLSDIAEDGPKTVYVKVRDFVEHDSTLASAPEDVFDTIILDLTEPSIVFNQATDYLTVNKATAQPGSISDATSGIASYQWSVASGPGVVTFSDRYVASPLVSADTEGTYDLGITVSDNAGNVAYTTVQFIWDTTPPSDIQNIALTDSEGNAFGYYTASARPNISWDVSTGADFYRVAFSTPDWDNPEWDAYEERQVPNLSMPAPAGPHDNDGEVTLYITAWDKATNRSNTTAEATVSFFIDTIAPVITNNGAIYLSNAASALDYYNGAETIWDENHSSDPEPVSGREGTGSGIASYHWQQVSGPGGGTVSFDNPNIKAPTWNADLDGDYSVTFTATDFAGNSTVAEITLSWDTTPPDEPVVSGIDRTPNLRPSWTWSSGGGGTGIYRYGFEDGANWIAAGVTDLLYRPSTALPADPTDGTLYTLYVQEKDEAGNWSASGTYQTWIDPNYRSAPSLTVEGTSPRNTQSITWNWSSGTGALDGEGIYRYSLDGGVTWINGAAGSTGDSYLVTGLSEGTYTFKIEEYYLGAWQGTADPQYFSTNTVVIDLTGPAPPTVSSATPTNDTRPYWSWTTGGSGDAAGLYRYSIDGGGWSATTSSTYLYTPTALSEGDHTLYVQERDIAGNWSGSGTKTVKVDVTPPTLNSTEIQGGATYYNSRTMGITVSAETAGETVLQMSMWRYDLDGTAAWSSWTTFSSSFNVTFDRGGDGYKYFYVKLRDEAGNESSYVSDHIILDTVAPVVSSFSINNGDLTTTSQGVTLYSSVSDATSYVSTMRVKNGSGSFSSNYTYAAQRSWTLSSGYGAKKVTVEYTDAAGNSTSATAYYDAIFYGTPSIVYAEKGETTDGNIEAFFNSYGSEIGTNNYYLYYNYDGGTARYGGYSTTATSLDRSYTAGTLHYFFVRVYNSSVGGYTEYSAYQVGYSSNIVIIYNDQNSTDTSTASAVRSTVLNSFAPSSYIIHASTKPTYTATLFPERLIPASWTTSDDRYIIYGDPVILTPGITFANNSTKVRNIVHRAFLSGKGGVIAMGYGGSGFLYRCSVNWSSWGYADQGPIDITSPYTMGVSLATQHMYQWTSGNSTWSSPISSTVMVGGASPLHNARVYIRSGGSFSARTLVYRESGLNPPGGYIYGKDDYSGPTGNHFSILRQGRFLYYAYNELADYYYTGKVHFFNLVARMNKY